MRLLRIDGRIPGGRRRNDGGQQSGLLKGQICGAGAEVLFGRRLNAISAAPKVNRVEVALEDLVLAEVVIHLHRQHRLADFAQVIGGLPQVIILHVLLGESGAALALAAGEVIERRARDAAQVNSVVGVEVLIFRGDDGVAHVVRQALQGNRGPIEIEDGPHLGCAVFVVNARALSGGDVVRLGNLQGEVKRNDADDSGNDCGEAGA